MAWVRAMALNINGLPVIVRLFQNFCIALIYAVWLRDASVVFVCVWLGDASVVFVCIPHALVNIAGIQKQKPLVKTPGTFEERIRRPTPTHLVEDCDDISEELLRELEIAAEEAFFSTVPGDHYSTCAYMYTCKRAQTHPHVFTSMYTCFHQTHTVHTCTCIYIYIHACIGKHMFYHTCFDGSRNSWLDLSFLLVFWDISEILLRFIWCSAAFLRFF